MTQSWTYATCESCLKNAHRESKMVRRTIISTDSTDSCSTELYVCTACGYTRKQ